MIANPQDRKAATAPLFKAIGGEVEHYWFGVGSNTLYIVTSMPDDNDTNLEAITMLVCASGIVQSMNMVKLLTSEEAVSAMKKAAELSYTPQVVNALIDRLDALGVQSVVAQAGTFIVRTRFMPLSRNTEWRRR